jgi:hypothetical protein
MNLKSYLDLCELLKQNISSREERRSFALTNVLIKDNALEQLLAWTKEHRVKLKKPLLSEKFTSSLYNITLILGVIAFIFGFVSGVGLLSYSGHEPVNIIYFIAMVVFLPLFTMFLTLISMFRANSSQSLLIHISPAFWMEKIVALFPKRVEDNLKNLKINPLLSNWIIIRRSQIVALFFSFGLLFSLLGVVATKDIAFAWSTTLNISAESFHSFLNTLALPWQYFFPSAVPSVELIEQSQYFRLGDKLSQEMINNASKLGEWWKFLLFATLFYAIVLRFIVYVLASFGLKRAIKKSFLTLDGVERLLKDMNEPIISTNAPKNEQKFVQQSSKYGQKVDSLDASYDFVLGWAIPKSSLVAIADSMSVLTPKFFEVGGGNSLDEDNEIVHLAHGEILLYVKAWEPPIMDFMDFLDSLSSSVDKIVVYPIGTKNDEYKTNSKEVSVWARKLSTLNSKKVWLKR